MNTKCEYEYLDNKNTKCEKKFLDEVRKGLFGWFSEYDWKWFVTIQIIYKNMDNVEKYTEKMIKTLCKKNKVQEFGYCGVVVRSKFVGDHIHLLMTSSNENDYIPETPIDKKGLLHIKPVTDPQGVFYYISYKNTPDNHFHLISYNPELLNQYRKS